MLWRAKRPAHRSARNPRASRVSCAARRSTAVKRCWLGSGAEYLSAPRSARDRGDAVVGGRTGQESRSTGQPAAASMTDSTILQTFKE
jgi:hypothetical protein